MIIGLLTVAIMVSCGQRKTDNAISERLDVDKQLNYCMQQAAKTLEIIPADTLIPRMIVGDAKTWKMVPAADWTSGFWPGILWYLYEYTKDEQWKNVAAQYTGYLTGLSSKPAFDHDLGFQVFCSFGNGYRLTNDSSYRKIINRTADTLATLYNPKVGTILSWPFRVKELEGHNTIIDNMMNLEMLLWSCKDQGKKALCDMAVKHAEVTMKNHFRPDHSAYHVVVYDENGKMKKGMTYQGQADETMWARGQAWAIYGYTMMYRETGDARFLDFAQKVTDVYLKRLPEDLVPYWDFDAPNIPNDTRDASAAAITASALLDLSGMVDKDKGESYRQKAEQMLISLSTDKYQSRDKNTAFLIHSRGSRDHERDISITYADYYYLEALLKFKKLPAKQ
ncbi:MAG: glucuronyl hydrolase [Pedobacter sp.]|nr:MAG: glucuronyl hydrolase [Pedobacter sp.]